MGEEPKNENKTEFKGNLGFIWLIGILVTLLGCVTIYTLKITADNKELKQAPQTAPVVTETQSQPQVQTPVQAQTTDNNSKTTSSTEKTSNNTPAISSIGENVRHDGDYKKEYEIKLYRCTKGDRYEYFDIEYTIMGEDKGRLKVVNNTTNKTILNEKTDKEIVDIIINDNRTDKKSFEAIVLFSDGTIGKLKTNKLTKLTKYKNISRIQIVNWSEGVFNTNTDDAFTSAEVIVAIDKDGKAFPVSIITSD